MFYAGLELPMYQVSLSLACNFQCILPSLPFFSPITDWNQTFFFLRWALCSHRWPPLERSACLRLPGGGTKGVCHQVWLSLQLSILLSLLRYWDSGMIILACPGFWGHNHKDLRPILFSLAVYLLYPSSRIEVRNSSNPQAQQLSSVSVCC